MTFLKNKRAGKKWITTVNSGQPQQPIAEPAEYPCFAYLVVGSFGYEEESACYLYVEDVEKMLEQIRQ